MIWAEKNNSKLKIIRTRDQKLFSGADFLLDIGGVFDPDKNRFDHHQKGGAGSRENGVWYATFGLVWSKYGILISGNKEVASQIEEKLVVAIDARDNGVNIPSHNELKEYRIIDFIFNLNITSKESESLIPERFKLAVLFAKNVLEREIFCLNSLILDKQETEKIIDFQNSPSILILDIKIDWHEAVAKNPKIKFVVYPEKNNKDNKGWCIQAARGNLDDYNSNRAEFPIEWRGLRGPDLVKVSGVEDSIFCHNGGFFAVTETKEGAVQMAQKALQI